MTGTLAVVPHFFSIHSHLVTLRSITSWVARASDKVIRPHNTRIQPWIWRKTERMPGGTPERRRTTYGRVRSTQSHAVMGSIKRLYRDISCHCFISCCRRTTKNIMLMVDRRGRKPNCFSGSIISASKGALCLRAMILRRTYPARATKEMSLEIPRNNSLCLLNGCGITCNNSRNYNFQYCVALCILSVNMFPPCVLKVCTNEGQKLGKKG